MNVILVACGLRLRSVPKKTPISTMRLGRPSLGPIDHPMIAVPSRGGCKRGEIEPEPGSEYP